MLIKVCGGTKNKILNNDKTFNRKENTLQKTDTMEEGFAYSTWTWCWLSFLLLLFRNPLDFQKA